MLPRLVFWETTKACPLACVHCRASAQRCPGPDELTTGEAKRLIDELAAAGRPTPVLILTGGDCLARSDLVELSEYATHAGVPVAISPAVSDDLEPGLLTRLRASGVRSASLSLDGAQAGTHDHVRAVDGHMNATIASVKLLQEHGFAVQVNTAVMAGNVDELADVAALLVGLGVRVWEVFFLIGVGRGDGVAEIGAAQYEDVCHFLVDAARYGMTVRTVEAPFFRRVRSWRSETADLDADPTSRFGLGPLYGELRARLRLRLGPPTSRVLAPTISTRDGKGIVFVASNGDVYPAGFLPLVLGSIREKPLLETYRDDPTLKAIRASDFAGRCGRCEFADECGGSRARAFASSGDPLGDDPACTYQPLARAASSPI